jgi:hypothetical protein
MILFSTVATYKEIASKVQHKLQRHVRYNDIMEAPTEYRPHDGLILVDDDKRVSIEKIYHHPITISSIAQDVEEGSFSKGKKPNTNQKSVQFHDVVQVHTPIQEPITLMEKRMTWYSVEELQKMKEENHSYIKFLSSIGTEEINYLLNNEVDDTENDNNDEFVCWRGLERFIPTTTCNAKNEPLAVTLHLRRQNIVLNVLRKQSRIRRNEEELPIEQSIDEIIRVTSIENSKSCSDYAYQVAQKSYCFSRIAA